MSAASKAGFAVVCLSGALVRAQEPTPPFKLGTFERRGSHSS